MICKKCMKKKADPKTGFCQDCAIEETDEEEDIEFEEKDEEDIEFDEEDDDKEE